MKLTQGILDELRHQAEVQGKKNYRGVEVDYRTVLAMCDEVEESRKQKNLDASRLAVLDELKDLIECINDDMSLSLDEIDVSTIGTYGVVLLEFFRFHEKMWKEFQEMPECPSEHV